jgi:hypothetical protein
MGLVLTWPVGRDADRQRQGAPTGPVLAYLAAASVSGALAGAAVGGIGSALRSAGSGMPTILAAAAAAAVIAAAGLQWHGRLAPLRERQVQVPRRWLLWRSRTMTAAAFGLVIGSGFLTHVKHATAYALGALALVAPTMLAAVAIGAGYGIGRGGTAVVTWIADRRRGRRPRWPGIGPSSPMLNRSLAICAVAAFSASHLVLS